MRRFGEEEIAGPKIDGTKKKKNEIKKYEKYNKL